MILYQCSKCAKTFAATNPKHCPYCQYQHLQILSHYRVQVFNTSDVKSKRDKYSVSFDIQVDSSDPGKTIPEILCNILKLPSISIRHVIDNPYVSRIKRCHKTTKRVTYEYPVTVELRVYSPQRAYVLLDSEDKEAFSYLVSQYKQHGWKVLDLRHSKVSFIRIVRRFLNTFIVPRLKNDAVRKDILCLITDDGDSSDNDSC